MKHKNKIKIYCRCGCGLKPKKGNKYINGHNQRGKLAWNSNLSHEDDERILAGKEHPMYNVHLIPGPNYIDGYSQERSNANLKGHGFNPLNEKNNVSTTMHHLSDNETVVFEPKAFHDACYHNYSKEDPKREEAQKMADEIALMWYSVEWFHKRGIPV